MSPSPRPSSASASRDTRVARARTRCVPDHGEGGAEVVDVVDGGARRRRLVLLDHRHVRRRRVRHASTQ